MNDDAKTVGQNTPPVAQSDQPQAQVQSVAPIQPPTPVGSANKEVGPATAPVSEFVKPSEVEPQIDQDLKELGIEAKKDAPGVTDEHVGIVEHAKQFTPVASSSKGKIVMPMSEEEIADKLKTGQNDDSGKWLAGLIKKIIAWGFKSQ